MRKIFFLTRTYPDMESGGGGIIRKGTVDFLRQYGFDVWIVAPNYNSRKVDINDDCKHILLPHAGCFKICALKESLGIWDDYLEGWTNYAASYLTKIVNKDDLLIATSGGELGMIILAHKLKKNRACKFIIHFHDPLSYTTINGIFLDYIKTRLHHVNRDKAEAFYLKSADAIITSSISYKDGLIGKYPFYEEKIHHNYFGYIKELPVSIKPIGNPICIVYGGAMGKIQSPEILAEAIIGVENVKVSYVGDWKSNPSLKKYENSPQIDMLDSMLNRNYINYLLKEADIGFISLQGKLASLCVPSKLYEFINIGIPVLASVKGDAGKIISDNEYGMIADYDVNSLRETIKKMSVPEQLLKFRNNISEQRFVWSMEYRVKEFISIIRKIYE